MSLDMGERKAFVRMLAERVEAENQALESVRGRMGMAR